jgi:hypothetical protein
MAMMAAVFLAAMALLFANAAIARAATDVAPVDGQVEQPRPPADPRPIGEAVPSRMPAPIGEASGASRGASGEAVPSRMPAPIVEQSFLYLIDPHGPSPRQVMAGYALAFSSSAGAIRPIPGHFDQEGVVHALSLEAGVVPRLSIYANTMIAQAIGQSEVGTVAVQAGARVLLTNPRTQRLRIVLQGAFLREFGSSMGVIGEVTGSYDIGRVRLAAALHAEHVFAPGRDPIDLYAVTGVSVRVLPLLRVGAEYVAQDLEAADGDDAERGVRHYLGPNLALSLYDHHILVTAGAAAQAAARPGVLARAALTYVY